MYPRGQLRRASLAGEMGAGALAGMAGVALAMSAAVFADSVHLSAPGAFAGLLERIGSVVHGGLAAVLPAAAPARAVGLGIFAACAVLMGAAMGALLRDVRAAASVGFWLVLTGITLGVSSVLVLGQVQPLVLAELRPVVVLFGAATFALGLMLLVYFRRALGIPYEPRLGRAERVVREEDPAVTWFHQPAPVYQSDAWA